MKRNPLLKHLFFISFAFMLCACQEDSPEPIVVNEDYIKGEFGSESLNYSQMAYSMNDSIASVYIHNPLINHNQINLIRSESKDGSRSIHIYLLAVELDTMQVPIEFNSRQSTPAIMEVLFIDDPKGGNPDDYYYKPDDITLRVLSKTNDVLSGSFQGKLKTSTGKEMTVKNGEFKVKIIRKQN